MAGKKETTITEDFEAIETLIEKMDDEEISLDESFTLYEESMKLLKDLSKRIDKVEEKVKLLNEDGELEDLDE